MPFKIFKENVEFIKSFNSDGSRPYKLGLHQFADLTYEESVPLVMGMRCHPTRNHLKQLLDMNV